MKIKIVTCDLDLHLTLLALRLCTLTFQVIGCDGSAIINLGSASFTKKHNIVKLVYYEFTNEAQLTIARETQIKSRLSKRNEGLINSTYLEWKDLFGEFMI